MTRAIAIVAIGLAVAGVEAQDSADALVAEVRAARRGVRAIDAAFEQDKEMTLFAETLRARGRLRVLGADRLRWDVDAPDRSSFVYDRGTIVFRGPGGRVESLGGTGLFGAVLGDLGALLGGDLGTLSARYRLAARAGTDGTTTLVATPKDAALRRSVTEIRVTFAPDRRVLRELVLSEPSGDRSTIRFTRFDVAASVPPSAFRL